MFTLSVSYLDRPIISACNSCTEYISRFIDGILQAHAKGLDYYRHIISGDGNFEKELDKLKSYFMKRNYPLHIVEHANSKSKSLSRDVRGMFEKNCLFLSGDFKFQVSPKSAHSMPPKNSPWLEMQSFNRCIHFLKASRYADLGTVIRY